MTGFALPVDDEIDLVLRERWTVPALHRLIVANQDRLAVWEPWAAGDQSEEHLDRYTGTLLQQWLDGTYVPTAVRRAGALVGALGARIDAYFRTAELGYWLDGAVEGRGILTRAGRVLLDYLVTVRGVQRIEIRCSVANVRSRAVAERLGFPREGTCDLSKAHATLCGHLDL